MQRLTGGQGHQVGCSLVEENVLVKQTANRAAALHENASNCSNANKSNLDIQWNLEHAADPVDQIAANRKQQESAVKIDHSSSTARRGKPVLFQNPFQTMNQILQ